MVAWPIRKDAWNQAMPSTAVRSASPVALAVSSSDSETALGCKTALGVLEIAVLPQLLWPGCSLLIFGRSSGGLARLMLVSMTSGTSPNPELDTANKCGKESTDFCTRAVLESSDQLAVTRAHVVHAMEV